MWVQTPSDGTYSQICLISPSWHPSPQLHEMISSTSSSRAQAAQAACSQTASPKIHRFAAYYSRLEWKTATMGSKYPRSSAHCSDQSWTGTTSLNRRPTIAARAIAATSTDGVSPVAKGGTMTAFCRISSRRNTTADPALHCTDSTVRCTPKIACSPTSCPTLGLMRPSSRACHTTPTSTVNPSSALAPTK